MLTYLNIPMYTFCIFTTDSSNSDKAEQQFLDTHKPLLRGLCKDLTVPLYFLQVKIPTVNRKFCMSPQPGTLAFLQRLHNLNLFHRHSLYLYRTNDQYKMADKAGVRHVAAKSLLSNPQMVVSAKCATKVEVKPELKRISFKSRTEKQSPSATIPLFTNAEKTTDGYYQELSPWNYLHGICFRDLSVIEK